MIGKRFVYAVLAAFVAGILALVFIQYNSSSNIFDLVRGNEKMVAEFNVANELKRVEHHLNLLERKIDTALAARQVPSMDAVAVDLSAVRSGMETLQLIRDDPHTEIYVDELQSMIEQAIFLNNRILDSFYHKGPQAAARLADSGQRRQLMDSIHNIRHKIETSRQQLVIQIIASADRSGRRALRWGVALFALIIASSIGLFWFILSRLRRQQDLLNQLNTSQEELKQAVAVKEKFLANMSHEIRTPLNAILGFSQLLQKQPADAVSREYVQAIDKAAANLLTIINDVLDLSKIEAGMMRIEKIVFKPRELLADLESIFREKAHEKSIDFLVDVTPAVPEKLLGDPARLSQVLINLLGNAFKFTDRGTISLTVTPDWSAPEGFCLRFDVKDSGIGIRREDIDDIFERFGQVGASVGARGGTGLGLSIVQELVRLQKGRVSVESEWGAGSCFSVVLPYLVVPAPASIASNAFQPLPSGDQPLPDLSHLRVLVVEDNQLNRTLLTRMLEQWQIRVECVADGESAIRVLGERSCDLVLLDIQLPGMDGYDTVAAIRKLWGRELPVIAMTAHVFAGEKEKCLAAGMNGYLSKPILEEELLETIREFGGINHFSVIDLRYMHSVSAGDREYEAEVSRQFLELVPQELTELEASWKTGDVKRARQVAHQLKTSISVMGLNLQLNPFLDAIEYQQLNDREFAAVFSQLSGKIHQALQEASSYLSVLET
ncbi:response regulator [Flavihumibacter petaseus]|uniref:histidine kinase n=1 Tax=Flavihumibacter petaseus NBRC 106054 TaxID=1220578 RepID=A0A0E9MUB0_9BACT|nr:response regulator [Flavihumibacter petaseus]GAO41063.1 putative two-component hybrid sensor and regulator [Flavihumibacter petaseus NBRC 106054]